MPNTGVEEEYYRLRHFSITGKGVINRGDSLKSRRSRSNTSVASSNSRYILLRINCFRNNLHYFFHFEKKKDAPVKYIHVHLSFCTQHGTFDSNQSR